MFKLFTALLIFISSSIFSQSIEVVGGINKNIFFDYREDEGHFRSDYENNNIGPSFGIAIDSLRIGDLYFRSSIDFIEYRGKLYQRDGGQGGYGSITVETKKSILAFTLYPLNIRAKNLEINLGFSFALLLAESFNGIKSGRSGGFSYSNLINQDNYELNSKYYLGINLRVGYAIKIGETLNFVPQYRFSFNPSGDLREYSSIKSLRHFIGLGIKKKI